MISFLGRIRIRTRLYLIVSLAFLAIILLEIKFLNQERDILLEARQNNTNNVVETVYGIVEHYYSLSRNNKMSEQEAQQAALDTISNLRYDKDDYFWVNDMQPKMLMHPIKPSLNGTDLSNIKDPNGKYLFKEFVRQVGDTGEGFVDYYWPKPGEKEPAQKISYVKSFKPWNWVIGSGIYIDDIDARIADEIIESVILAALIALIILAVSTLIVYTIMCPINHLKEILNKVKNTGDISQRLDLESEAEFGEIVDSFNQMLEHFHQTILKVEHSVAEMDTSISSLTNIVHSTTTGVEHQQQKLLTINNSMQELNNSIEGVSQSSHEGHNVANETNTEAQQGKVLVDKTIRSITHLVDEVRTLAQKTQESTSEIQSMIDSLQKGANDVVGIIKQSQEQANDSVDISTQTGVALESIAHRVENINEFNEQISTSSSHQHEVAEDMRANLEDINNQASADLEGVQQVNKASTDLSELSAQLKNLMASFHR